MLGVGAHVLLVRGGAATLDGLPVDGDAVAALEAARAALPGVWVGWFGYEAGVRMLGLEPAVGRAPEAAWLLLDRWVVVDGGRSCSRAAAGVAAAAGARGDAATDGGGGSRALLTGATTTPPTRRRWSAAARTSATATPTCCA